MCTPSAGAVPVWDRLVRLLHWALVLLMAGCALSTLWLVGLHQPLGYAGLAVVGLRLLWGLVGSRHARFGQFVSSPRSTAAYLRQLLRRRAPRHLGHNPLGGWMIVALLATVLGLALTGWLYTTDRFWGDETVEQAHQALAWVLLGLVALHLAGVLFTSHHQRENLARAMLTGRKRAPAGDDVD